MLDAFSLPTTGTNPPTRRWRFREGGWLIPTATFTTFSKSLKKKEKRRS